VVARESGIEPIRGELSRNTIAWLAGIVLVYSIMFATGAAIFHNARQFMIFGGALVASAVLLVVVMKRERVDPQMTQINAD
jgi:hypothetical protein